MIKTIGINDDLSIRLVDISRRPTTAKCAYCGEGEYWNEMWPSGLALSKFLVKRFPEDRLRGLKVLVVGCGVGLEGLVLGRKGCTVSLLDHVPEALQIVQQNASLNSIDSIRTICCCWHDPDQVKRIGEYDVLIGADVIYEENKMHFIGAIIRHALKKNGMAIFADPVRSGVMAFFRHLSRSGFQVKWSWANSGSHIGKREIRIYCVGRRLRLDLRRWDRARNRIHTGEKITSPTPSQVRSKGSGL